MKKKPTWAHTRPRNTMNRQKMGGCCVLALLLAAAPVAAGQAPNPAPPTAPQSVAVKPPQLTGGTSLLPKDALDAFRLAGETANASQTMVGASGANFDKALRLQVTERPQRDYALRLNASSVAPVEAGDVVVATFFVRGVDTKDESGEALTAFVFERKNEPFTKSADVSVSAPVGSQWKPFQIPFAVKEALPAGGATIQFRLGSAAQSFEIGGLSVVNYGKALKLSDFPRPEPTYAGREPNAPWRKAAQERIERTRKADLTVRVMDTSGRPVPDAQVQVRMKRHAFGFGSVVNTGRLLRLPKTLQDAEDQRRYREAFEKYFNITVDEGSHKWPAWGNPQFRNEVLQTVDWMRERDIAIRGHVLVWPSWANSPKRLKTDYDERVAKNGKEAAKTWLRDHIRNHIRDIGTANRGKLAAWDVVNETYTNFDLLDILGRDALVEWFKLAKEVDPGARLFINENTILTPGGRKRAFYESEIKFLLDKGAPLEGIGMQGHTAPMPMDEVKATLDRFAKFNLPIQITEFDVGLAGMDERLQADFTRDYLTMCFSHPAVTDFVMWGFWEGQHWRPYKALWRKDWSIKPNGQAWLDLVFKEWWTSADGRTDAQGSYATRGFLGRHEVTVTHGGKTETAKATLDKNGESLTVTLRQRSIE